MEISNESFRPEFLATKKSVLATKSKNLGASWPLGFFLKSSPDGVIVMVRCVMTVEGPKLSTISEHAHNTGYNPLWFIEKGSHHQVSKLWVSSISSHCLGKEPVLFSRKPDSREWKTTQWFSFPRARVTRVLGTRLRNG